MMKPKDQTGKGFDAFILILQRQARLLRRQARGAARGWRNGPADKRETKTRPSCGQQQQCLHLGPTGQVKLASLRWKGRETFSTRVQHQGPPGQRPAGRRVSSKEEEREEGETEGGRERERPFRKLW